MELLSMTVHVVIVTKKDCEPNVYVYKNREDAIKQFCYYQMLGEKVVLEEAEVREMVREKEEKCMEPSKDQIVKATEIIRTGMTNDSIDGDDFNWAIHLLQLAFRNGYSVVKTS